ncbi:DUF4268 domain-containing protein [Fulvivirga sediminis]|uniref:DUF4268 domain-containing protein n=1 Tax=Fulvivirga sediminis TaxID=2803949 RepID=A0A937JY65_9BACT|nr:DUF4268 domain-containing protein [Fulvivirga sediminis]MBL3655359.1 DUF4268 domain-containing protein [Fulvivirga sediminis]
MYTREQVAKLKEEFWTTFGRYIAPHLSAEGLKINWVNYKTGLKDVYFRMEADKKKVYIGIELTHSDEGIRELFYEQLQELHLMLAASVNEEWEWEKDYHNEYGQEISRVFTQKTGVNVFNKETWPDIISFLKPRIIALDEFWSDGKYAFEALK